jgi:hypothetical protein
MGMRWVLHPHVRTILGPIPDKYRGCRTQSVFTRLFR